jgi:hypothetical protein
MAPRKWSLNFEIDRTITAETYEEANRKKDAIARLLQRRVRTIRGFARSEVFAGPAEVL